jgi:hypothetical protein
MSSLKTSLIILIILIAGITAASASLSIKNLAVTPSGDLVSGQTPPNPVTVSFVINFNAVGTETFPSSETLSMSTDLDNAQWSYITSLDGNPNPAVTGNGRNLNINGWVLSYPSKRALTMQVTLNGQVPTVTASGNKTIIQVSEIGSQSEAISGSGVTREAYIINPADKNKAVSDVKTALTAFRALIDAKAQAGVDTTAAMEKYSAANTAIQNADKATSFAAAQTYLNNAQVLLKDGQTALERADAQQVINSAQTPIDQTDDLITYFKVNRSMGKDPRLESIIQKRDRAADLLSEANDLLPKNDFSGAKDKALQSSDMASQSYDAALALRKDVGEANPLDSVTKGIGGIFGGATSGLASILIYIVIIVVIAVVVVIGIILYRRRQNDWDELA